MNGLMDGLIDELYDPVNGGGRAITFRYFEMLGNSLTDCMQEAAGAPEVRIGEALDGTLPSPNTRPPLCVSC
jgi:hypothetical protein